MTATAKLFMNGRSQAVRLPKEFRFEGSQVSIRRDGNKIVLEPITHQHQPEAFWTKLDEMGARELQLEPVPEYPPLEPEDTRTG